MRPIPLLLLAVALTVGSAAWADEHTAGHAWSYEGPTGPSHWAMLGEDNATCGVGTHQSPINIDTTHKEALAAIEFNYTAAPLSIIDNGHTIQVNVPPGQFIQVHGQRYDLVQFHFHRPSEEQVHGRAYSMVAHLVHKNARGELAVVAVLLREGKANAFLSTLWDHLPSNKGVETKVAGSMINVADLLPAQRGYYNFDGSLTTPPCSEQVNWFVLKTPVEVSAAQIEVFAKRYSHNARPVQPINDRTVLETAD